MTVLFHVGRRVSRAWFRRQAGRVKGFMSFQENIWMMIKQSLSLAKKKANQSGKIDFVLVTDREIEDLNYEIEWIKITIRGTREQEEEEYNDSMKMYSALGKLFKPDMPVDVNMKKHIKSKILSVVKVEEAYKRGFGAVEDNNIANKLLELGIITHVEWIDDFNARDVAPKPDM